MQTYSRKKSRFPAFDDEAGVKLLQSNQRVLFDGQDDLITNYQLEAKDIFERPLPKTKRTRHVQLNEEPHKELARHKANLPMYDGDRKESKKVKLFEERKPKDMTKPKTTFNARTTRSATPFAPKYVPSSLIPDEPADAISPRELMQRMEKPRQSYILFASEEKQPDERKKSRQRLDRSLRGILQEETSSIENSKYFHD
ncbi:hypothetical protein P7D52_09440 [Enterococcus dongliensis]|uniref:Uncharacterized protein n=1 Tax=Enterococcus dongliensis TaxID=2559925 RepID=A0AAP5U1H0_9ENTE|nr:hypothetical protein [Enterococcus dongliensis]MDT2597086.1 hypothetical protein [Enterococcus dongliensis]MDT2604272.1 hypothetical protein [Enterococcus dongliensis]MDT2634990.1 hypothetical protein [Enterococcus dongliensis]MDT2636202.1 hypothetical protein [Enterococcus dongliensis]MDT2643013.1 hypothetical protein [Enterococcus dongliensis]